MENPPKSRNELVVRENGAGGLPAEVGIENGHGGGGQRRAGIALFQHEGNGDLRVIVGGEGHEHAVIFQAAAQLGRAGLGTGGNDAVLEVGIDHAAGLGVAVHSLFHGLKRRIADVQGIER